MFNILIKILFVSLMIISSANAINTLSKSEIAQFEKLPLFKAIKIKIDSVHDLGTIYLLNIQVQGNKDEVFLTKDKKLLISGDIIDTTTGLKLSAPVDVTTIRGKEAFIYGKGQEEYFLFTDPECVYCKKFETYFSQIEDKVKIRVFYYPLDIHENARDLSLYILSQKTLKNKITAMFEANVELDDFKEKKYSKAELDKLEDTLDEQIQIAEDFNVKGTPAMFDSQGNKVVWISLLQKLGIKLQ